MPRVYGVARKSRIAGHAVTRAAVHERASPLVTINRQWRAPGDRREWVHGVVSSQYMLWSYAFTRSSSSLVPRSAASIVPGGGRWLPALKEK